MPPRPLALLAGLALAAGCTPEGRNFPGTLDASAPDATRPTDAGERPDAGAPIDAGAPVDAGESADAGAGLTTELVDPAHRRELRGVWIATVSNINFPSRPGLSASAAQAELDAIVDLTADVGMNAIVFQVRPECDALYRSSLEPWSRFLTGTQGQDPGYDPLADLIERAHARGVEVHAWLNPYRAKSSASSTAVAPHLSITQSAHAHRYGNFVWMDPAALPVQSALQSVVEDIVTRYDVDGLHFDDYFYPYPNGEDFPDDSTWAEYQGNGGTLARDDWRRDNVNRMVEAIYARVTEVAPHVRFGISPFGIYRPGMPAGINGLDQYAAIFADPVLWMDRGWVDYLAPQLYWPSTQTAQAYGPLVDWWSALAHDGRVIVPGNFLSKLGDSASWSVDEFRTQVRLTRAEAPEAAAGNIWFTIAPLESNRDGIADVFRDELYPTPALPPALPGRSASAPMPPGLSVEGDALRIEAAAPTALKGHVIYVDQGGQWVVQQILPTERTQVILPPGRYAVTSVDRFSQESRGLAFDL